MKFEDFSPWKSKFLERNEGYYPRFEKLWFDKVNETHEDIRKFLGGEIVQRFYKLKSQQGTVEEKDVKDIVDQLLTILPYYLDEYGYNRSIFLSPTTRWGTHNIIKTSKHIWTYAEQRHKEGTVTAANLKLVEKLISQLGQVWSKAKTTESELEVSLSTTQRGFMLLGHYGPDPDSCFRQGSDKTQHKYIFAQTPNTFVITISKKHPKKAKQVNVARCMGFFNRSFGVASLHNYYFVPKFSEGDALQCIRMLLEELWQDKVEFHEDVVGTDGYVFHNPSCNWCYTKGKGSVVDKIPGSRNSYLKSDIKNLRLFYCIKCGLDGSRESDFLEVDDGPSCHRCYEQAEECELSRKRTFKGLVAFFDQEDRLKMIHPDVAKQYTKCSRCENYMTAAHTVDDQQICFGCLETYYTECELCNKLCEDSELKDIGFMEICGACNKLGLEPIGDTIE